MRGLEQKTALVTGGASGLGTAIAQRLASEGAAVVITDIQRDLGQTVASEGGYTFLHQNVCDETQWTRIVGEIEGRFGRLHILVNNAGVLGSVEAGNPENATLADWKTVFAVNVEGVFLGCRAAIPAMRRAGGGAIVNISSMADRISTPDVAAYGASKAAVRQLTTSIARYCARQKLNVRCNSVLPGMVRTPLLNDALAKMAQQRSVSFDQLIAELKAQVPLGDFTRVDDVAAAVAFLASEDAQHVTGSALLVDGGIVHCS
jgi:3(or 17)beta-hydroxysteroid dehydrogenase